jgi:hypothetical protein
MEDDGIFYGHLVYFTVFCYILRTFGIVRGNLVYFSRFGILYEEKSGNPDMKLEAEIFENLALGGSIISDLGQKKKW